MRTHLRDLQLKLVKVAPVSPGLSLNEVFSDLGSETLEAFQELQARSIHPPRTMLFAEGQTPAGIFFLRSGKVRLFMSGPAGERLISRTAQPGEILGITEGVSGDSYRMSAETLIPSEVGFIDREAFLQFLRAHGAVAFRLVQLLSNEVDSRYERLRSLVVGRSRQLKLKR